MTIGSCTLKQYDSKTRLWTFEFHEIGSFGSGVKILTYKIVVEYPFSDLFLDGLGSIMNTQTFRIHRAFRIHSDLKIKHIEEVT